MAEKQIQLLLTRAVEHYRNFGSANEDDLQALLNAGVCEGDRGKLIKKIARLSR